MVIRDATAEDVCKVLPMVNAICALHKELDAAKYGFLPDPASMYERWLEARAEDPQSVFIVAEREDRLCGFVVGTCEHEVPIYDIDRYGFIHDLWVDPTYRNEGVGRQLAMLAIERFSQLGMKQVRLDTAAKNDAARALFEKCGFRPSVVEMLLEISQPPADLENR